jgi:hypothetical protein
MTDQKERPILFSGLMVKAILEDRKTQTRRVIKPQPQTDGCLTRWRDIELSTSAFENCAGPRMAQYCPYGRAGERLWVRETWGYYRPFAGDVTDRILYKADLDECGQCPLELDGETVMVNVREPYKPSIHMPRKASRLLLEIVSLGAERLREIDAEGAQAEGCSGRYGKDSDGIKQEFWSPEEAFAELWDDINGKRAGCTWEANPWVWVINFKRIEGEGAAGKRVQE